MIKKYAVFSQKVQSRSDGQWHHISAEQLMRLYQVDPAHCIIIRPERAVHGINLDDYIHLRPRHDGKYLTKEGMPNVTD